MHMTQRIFAGITGWGSGCLGSISHLLLIIAGDAVNISTPNIQGNIPTCEG